MQERPDLHMPLQQRKETNSHNFKIKNLNLLTITFLAVYFMNRGKSLYMNELSMRVNNTSH